MPRLVIVAVALMLLAAPAAAQQREAPGWVDRWFWGASAGLLMYDHPSAATGLVFDPIVGGHWLITGRRSGLYLGYEQAFFLDDATAEVPDGLGTHTATFKQFRRISAALLAMPLDAIWQPFAGVGVAIQQVISPDVAAAAPGLEGRAERLVNDRASGAAFLFMGGFNFYLGPLVVFGHYKTTAGGEDFLLGDINHVFAGGLRYNLVSRKEEITGSN